MRKKKSPREAVLKYVLEQYGTSPEYTFESDPEIAVLRHKAGRKWYGIIMNVPKSKLGLSGDERIDILNVKCDPAVSGSMCLNAGIYPGYHMNKQHWISILLDGTVEMSMIEMLIDASFELTAVKVRKKSPQNNVMCK